MSSDQVDDQRWVAWTVMDNRELGLKTRGLYSSPGNL